MGSISSYRHYISPVLSLEWSWPLIVVLEIQVVVLESKISREKGDRLINFICEKLMKCTKVYFTFAHVNCIDRQYNVLIGPVTSGMVAWGHGPPGMTVKGCLKSKMKILIEQLRTIIFS